ncbi:DUF3387 domain-containing protein [Sphingobacterium sp. JB170]|uniref:DUF3387 domain-containing protein n=1 Tax=Sphingobacterium sp. JB170 TaxID=1434842 RepID=UPI00097F3D91|nr:DUF3387 domain-containing protein [Sphingobacterium sp. JB170]SJN48194.1 Type I restriction-modification system, restriction subunit R [Sphingobacterium sp. JB170]
MKLHQYGYPPITQDDVYKNVLEQTENFKKNRSYLELLIVCSLFPEKKVSFD